MTVSFIQKSLKGVSCMRSNAKVNWWDRFVEWYMQIKARQILSVIEPYIKGKVLDVGMGHGSVACALMRKGFKVEGIDINDLSIYFDLKAKLYDGNKLPYKNKSIDTALVVSVLHHCGDTRFEVLKEAMRVAKRVILIEDTYRNEIERKWVSFHDQVTNWEFYNHKYLTTRRWSEVIRCFGGKIIKQREYSQLAFGYFYSRYCMFVIE